MSVEMAKAEVGLANGITVEFLAPILAALRADCPKITIVTQPK
jgi:hypothetical protein